ncbi:MAG: hypothetical protein IJS09_03370 [Treponema sp.]|nr:hypothetical protein [Treponema sp.]
MDFSQIDEGHTEGEDGMIFRYNRAERLSRAPKIVQDYYAGKMQLGNKGIFKSLVATRGNRFMLFSVIICAAAMMFMWYFGQSKNEDVINHVPATLSAFSFEDTVYVTLELSDPNKKYAQNAVYPVDVTFQFNNVDKQLAHEEIIVTKYTGKKQLLRTTFKDYDIIEVCAVLKMGDTVKTLVKTVQKQ